ncbi:dimethylarginine dimethylaminohydrolase family protein [Rhodovibrionaceae bacterium A322]
MDEALKKIHAKSTFDSAAYGGDGFSPRLANHLAEMTDLWGACGIQNEFAPLKQVLLHRPGGELAGLDDPDAVQMLASVSPELAAQQHDALAQAYRDNGVTVHLVEPDRTPPPNQIFCADLFAMTPGGAILARPASTVRAGEERFVARRLADLGVPILKTLTGTGTFEGADALWLDEKTVAVGLGPRTNDEGGLQVADALSELGVDTIFCDMPYGAMHLMGLLRIVDGDLALAWARRTPYRLVQALRERGYKVVFLPSEADTRQYTAFNFVTLAPRKILMMAGYDETQEFYEKLGITCVTVEANELTKAAGAVGCLSGIVERKS